MEETLNFKVIDGKLGDRQLRLAEASILTEGLTCLISQTIFQAYISQCILETLGSDKV